MGHWSSDAADIILPKAAVPSVKKALRESNNRVRDLGLARAKEIHREVLTTSKSSFEADMSTRHGLSAIGGWSSEVRLVSFVPFADRQGTTLDETVEHVADQILLTAFRRAKQSVPVPTQADAETVLAKATTATDEFPILGEAELAVVTVRDGVVSWKRTNDRAHLAVDSAMARALWDALDAVKWTRGTGGDVRYSDEHSAHAAAPPSVIRSYGKA